MRHRRVTAGTADEQTSDTLAGVSSLLWDERDLLSHLLFKLVEEQLVLTSGQTRWLAKADDELRAAVEQLQGVELLRAAGVDTLSRHLGAPIAATLRGLALRAPEPWSSILTAHREALHALVAEIDAVAEQNRGLLVAGADAAQETLDHISAAVHAAERPSAPATIGSAPQNGTAGQHEQ